VTLFVTNAVKLQKLPENWFIKHNKKSRTSTSSIEAKAREDLFKNQTIPEKTKE